MKSNDATTTDQGSLPSIPSRFERSAMCRVGRPSKLTAETVDKLLSAIEEGQTYKVACGYAAICYQTLRNWIEQARDDIDAENVTEYVVFLDMLSRAESAVERKAVNAWVSAFRDDYRAARDFLERRNPEEWGRRDTVDVNARVAVGVVLLPSVDTPPTELDPSLAIAVDATDDDNDDDDS